MHRFPQVEGHHILGVAMDMFLHGLAPASQGTGPENYQPGISRSPTHHDDAPANLIQSIIGRTGAA
jgi:hypothetical protein